MVKILRKSALATPRLSLDIQKSGGIWSRPISVLAVRPDPLKGAFILLRNLVIARVINAKASQALYTY